MPRSATVVVNLGTQCSFHVDGWRIGGACSYPSEMRYMLQIFLFFGFDLPGGEEIKSGKSDFFFVFSGFFALFVRGENI